jgi:hypothetical protein
MLHRKPNTVNTGNFHGLQRGFLAGKVEHYFQAAINQQNKHDTMFKILRRFFDRFDPTKGAYPSPC